MIYIMRHGQTEANRTGILQGRIDVPLNEEGIKQAEKTKNELDKKGVSFDFVYSSPLTRARQTAKIISGKDENDIVIDDRIAEISFGKYDGQKAYSNEVMHNFFKFPETCGNVDTVETYDSLLKRGTQFLLDLSKNEKLKDKNVLVLSHGALIHALLMYVDKLKLADIWKQPIGNCGYFVVEILDGEFKRIDSDFKEMNRIHIFSKRIDE